MTDKRDTNYSILLRLAILGVLVASVTDYVLLIGYEWGPGWDFKCNCDAAYTLIRGGNPYRALDYSYIKNVFTYLPFWLPIHGLLCKALSIDNLKTTIIYYPVYMSIFLLSLYIAVNKLPISVFDKLLFSFIVLAGFGGFIWIERTGNIAIFESIAFLFAITYLYRFCYSQDRSDMILLAIFFGLFMSIKAMTLIFLPLLALIPTSLRNRVQIALIAACLGLTPLMLSYIFYPELMKQYVLMVSDRIEGNINPLACTSSLYCFFGEALTRSKLTLDLGTSRALAFLASAFVLVCGTAIVLGIRGWSVWSIYRRYVHAPADAVVFAGTGFDIFLFSFLWVSFLIPRLAVYSYELLAIAFAFLVVRMPGTSRSKLALGFALAIPILVGQPMSLRHEGVFEPESIFNDFVQLLIALPAYFFLLLIYSSNAAPQSRSAHNSAH